MIGRLSRQTVRQTWPAYVGAFVALAFGVALLGVTVALVGAVTVTTDAPGVTGAERAQLDDLASMFGVMSGISLFMALFVVGSTFGFVVATRRRELGLIRLTGATPRQVRRLVLLESGLVAAAAMLVGCALTTALTPVALWALRAYGVTELQLVPPAPWVAWAIAAPCGAAVAVVGSWRASKRASRVAPAAALREASVERRRPTVLAMLVGVGCVAAVVTTAVLAGRMPPLMALIVAVFLPAVMVIGVMCVGTLLLPALAGLLARPFVGLDVSARTARDQLSAAARTTAATAAPVMAISAIAGSLVLTLSFTADWATAQDRARLVAPLVVETAGDQSTVAAIAADPTVGTVDVRRVLGLRIDDGREEVDVVDPVAAAAARGLHAVRGDLGDLRGAAVAVTESWTFDYGTDLGGTVPTRIDGQRVDLEIVAVVRDAPGLYGELLVPDDLVADDLVAGERVASDVVFVVPRAGVSVADVQASLAAGLAGDPAARVLTAGAWIDANDARARQANQVGLWVLLGPAGLYAAIAMVNTTLVAASQRRRQDAVARLIGATPRQVRRMAAWEAAFTGAAGLLVGGLVTGFVAWVVRSAIGRDVAGAAFTVPWVPMLGIAVTCAVLVVGAAVLGGRVHVVAGVRG